MASLKGQDGGASGLTPGAKYGVWGDSATGVGVYATSDSDVALVAKSRHIGIHAYCPNHPAVFGQGQAAILGDGDVVGVIGDGQLVGVLGECSGGSASAGIIGHGDSSGTAGGDGVLGRSGAGTGVVGSSYNTGDGLRGDSYKGAGVVGSSENTHAIVGHKDATAGSAGFFSNTRLTGRGRTRVTELGQAGTFLGHVDVTGNLSVTGAKSFKIDHPLDPANKYLLHSAVESSEMKNVYDGLATLDGKGEAVVSLPDWVQALNGEFRYQLTAIGAPCPNLHIAQEISNNRFKIAGGIRGLKVSWQVTGVRQDAWAKANPIRVEQQKTREERGRYFHPELYKEARRKALLSVVHPDVVQHVERATRLDKARQLRKKTDRRIDTLKRRFEKVKPPRPELSTRPK